MGWRDWGLVATVWAPPLVLTLALLVISKCLRME
jgi:hypothetical protein